MKKVILVVIFLNSVYLYANPGDYVQECISWIGRSEGSLIEIGALQRGADVDLRPFGMKLLRHFVWAKGNIGYWAQTSDGIIISTSCCLMVAGVERTSDGDAGLKTQKYGNKKDFDTDAEAIRQMVYTNNGRLLSTRDVAGIRTISYEYYAGNFKINSDVFVFLEDPEKNGYGSIDIKVERR
jgi:hypothetical protein